MFGLFRRPAPRPLSVAIRGAIERDCANAPVNDLSQLRMVELRGRYSDRNVTYFRVFDPTSVAERSMETQRYQDFDVLPGLILRSGHIEYDGVVVLTRPVIVRPTDTPSRTHADRTLHADDAHIVRGETGATANSTAAAPSGSRQAP